MFMASHNLTVAVVIAVVALLGMAAGTPPAQPTATICHVASAGGDLLDSARCPPQTLAYRLGYTPELAHLPGGEPVHVEPDGSCSAIPDRPFGFDFRDACRRHDLGYDLIRVGWVDARAKSRIDRDLFDGMLAACADEHGIRGLGCRAMAVGAWIAVSFCPTPSDPDPGSFSDPIA